MRLAPRMIERPIIKATTGCMGRGELASPGPSVMDVEVGNKSESVDVVAIYCFVNVVGCLDSA